MVAEQEVHMDIGVIANQDPAHATGLLTKLREAVRDGDKVILIDAKKRSIPKRTDVVLLVTSMLRHKQLDRFTAICRKRSLKFVRTTHFWSTLVGHCQREGLLPEPEIITQPTVVSEAIAKEPKELELEELRERLFHTERELGVLRRAHRRLHRLAGRPRKLDRRQAPVQDRPALDPSQLLRLWALARSPRRTARMNILCTAIESELEVDVESMLQRIERS
jgi:hypothetical protein